MSLLSRATQVPDLYHMIKTFKQLIDIFGYIFSFPVFGRQEETVPYHTNEESLTSQRVYIVVAEMSFEL